MFFKIPKVQQDKDAKYQEIDKKTDINEIKIKIFQLITCIFKNKNEAWKYSWMKRSQGTVDMKTWE